MKTEKTLELSKEFTSLFAEMVKKQALHKEELRVRGGLLLVFQGIMGLQLDVSLEEIKIFEESIS